MAQDFLFSLEACDAIISDLRKGVVIWKYSTNHDSSKLQQSNLCRLQKHIHVYRNAKDIQRSEEHNPQDPESIKYITF